VAESVFIAAMFVLYGSRYAELLERRGLSQEAGEVSAAVEKMVHTVESYGWDGKWFLRAYDAEGHPVGSHSCAEGSMFVEPQGFCTMAGIGLKDGRAIAALDSVQERLLGEFGVELVSPPYTVYHKELGEITSYPPGYKENGSVFSHNNPWVSIAETVLGRADKALDLYRRICPAYLQDKSEVHRSEPYVYAQTIAGRFSQSEGEAKNSWLTGTAAWAFVNVSQAILGVTPALEGLRIRPCLPAHIQSCDITRRYRGSMYRIHVKRTGAYSLTLDGVPQQGDTLSACAGRTAYEVEVTV
jgi:cellobiose phosphorylase